MLHKLCTGHHWQQLQLQHGVNVECVRLAATAGHNQRLTSQANVSCDAVCPCIPRAGGWAGAGAG